MADKKRKSLKGINREQQKNPETGSKKNTVSEAFFDELKDAFTSFNEIPESQKVELYGDKKYLDQFREYFKQEYPDLLDTIDKKDLPKYIKALEKQGFSLAKLTKDTSKLNEAFKSQDTERQVMEKSLGQLQKFCEDNNNIPDGTFRKFADAAGFTHDTLEIASDGKLKTIDHLYTVWKDFIDKEKITLENTSSEHIEHILTPEYNPTQRAMVSVAITKIRKELKGTLRTAFDERFPLPINIFTSYQDLINFKTEWSQFLDDHASEIDESLAKKLDSVIVTNGDIQKELLKSGRKFDDSKGFSEWEQNYRRIFNKLVTRQLFEEVEKTQESIDHYIEEIGKTFTQFPPYVNDILDIYTFNNKVIAGIDTSFHADLDHIDSQISELNAQKETATDMERKELRKKIKALNLEREQRRWQAYIAFLKTKDAGLAEVFAQLVGSKFDFSVLSADQQQLIVNVLVKNKLEDSIKNKVPELLSVKEEELTQFIHDLFDLKKMDLVIPTRHGPVPLAFTKKEFLASARKELPGLNDLEDIHNLPLNFITQLTESNADFFEDSPIFNSLYTDFSAKNGKFRFNDAYKVRIKKNGKIVEGYLSSYSPIDEKNTEDRDGKELYLYSQPITAPSQERELVTRPHDEGKSGVPVVIKDAEQQECDMEILDKKLNLNGDAFGALLFGYVLGQQSMNTEMSPEKEKELAEKLGKLTVYKEKEEGEEEESEPVTEKSEALGEETERQKFDKFWKEQIKGYNFPEKEYEKNLGFIEGTRLFIPFTSSEVPPIGAGNAWMQMEIINIDTAKGTFKVKIHGGELRLGKSEGAVKELPINVESFMSIKKAFSDKIYKLPNISHVGFDQQMANIKAGSLVSGLDTSFGSVKFTGSKFEYSLGNYAQKEVTHFGLYQPKATDEAVDNESGKLILYKIKTNPNGTINVSGDSMAGNYAKNFPSRDMDYTTFMLFVKEKGLQPKCKEQLKAIHTQVTEDKETPTTVRRFSINNVISFFKNGVNKIKDGIKKYDEERSEDLTDMLTSQGQLRGKIGGFLSPFSRISSSFESMGMEYFLERDNRIWKKVEKRQKYYEDFDYTKLYTNLIGPMLEGKIKIVPHYKIAAILLVHLKKGKGPYAKNLSTTEGQRVGQLLGKGHQERYLAIREKRIRDLEQNAHLYPGPWADQIKNELVELEMRYIVHVMDGRQLGNGDPDKYYFQQKYSKKFCDELESAYTGFFKQGTVEEGYTKAQDANFEFATVEYFRQLADRPQQAIPYLKVMATKAINDTQWQVFESAVLAGVLSGVFLNMTYGATQSYIQKICRTRGFIPGLFVKDIKQQYKMQRILDLFSGGDFSKSTGYSPDNYTFRNNIGPGKFIGAFKTRTDDGTRRARLSKFLELTGGNIEEKTLLDLHSDPKTSPEDKMLLEEFITKTNEKNEQLDPDVEMNTSSLTGSVLTKSQSVVEKMIRFDQNGFAGKNGDEINNMKIFSDKMQNAIPKGRLDSQEQIKFFMKKFFNWFGERGFTGNKMTEFLKRLKWCQENKGAAQDTEDVLYYSIVGEIVGSLSSHNAPPPIELQGALGAWKDFFKNNLDNILQDDVIISCFGGAQYKADYDKSKAKLESRETASLLLDREDNAMYMYGLSKEDKTQASAKKRELSNENKYLNKKLYDLAYDLSKRCGFNNRFKKDITRVNKTTSSKTTSKSTGAKIKNPEVIEKVRQILEGKQLDQEDDEFIPTSDDFNDFN